MAAVDSLDSRGIGAARLNWHPDVHRHYQEDLYFVLFRFTKQIDVDAFINRLMSSVRIDHYSTYVMLGYYDCLVRYWCPSSAHSDFLFACASATAEIRNMRTMRTTGIKYEWAVPQLAQKGEHQLLTGLQFDQSRTLQLKQQEERISLVARSTMTKQPSTRVIETATQALLTENLLLRKPEEPEANIKVFILLQPFGDRDEFPELEQVVDSLAESNALFKTASLYTGEGNMCSSLIRMVVSTYDDVLGATRILDERLGNLPLRTTTLFVGTKDVYETDNINNVTRLSPDDYELAKILNVDTTALGRLDSHGRAWLRDQVLFLSQQPRSRDIQGDALEALRAAVKEDRTRLREKFSFMLEFEYYFRNYVVATLADVFGRDWVETIRTKYPDPFKNLPAADVDDAQRWPLGVVLNVLRAATEDDYARGRVHRDLGENWLQVTRPVFNSRNAFAHGRLLSREAVPSLRDFSGDWGLQFAQILRAWPLLKVLDDYHWEKAMPEEEA